ASRGVSPRPPIRSRYAAGRLGYELPNLPSNRAFMRVRRLILAFSLVLFTGNGDKLIVPGVQGWNSRESVMGATARKERSVIRGASFSISIMPLGWISRSARKMALE